MKRKIAECIFIALSIMAIFFGGMYLFRSHLMPYHLAFLGKSEDEISRFSDNILPLFHALMRVAGACMIAIGLAALLITLIPHKRQEKWAWWVLLALFIASLLPMFMTTFNIARKIPEGNPKPPYILTLIMLALLVIAQALTFPYFLKRKDKIDN